jgi:hypothetical protein
MKFLSVSKHHVMKADEVCEDTVRPILDLSIIWNKWSASWTARFAPLYNAPYSRGPNFDFRSEGHYSLQDFVVFLSPSKKMLV